MAQTFRDLRVYKIGLDLLIKVERLTHYLPVSEKYREADQIKRAAKSTVANIAEGFGRKQYKRDFLRFLHMAVGSCDEVQVHLDILMGTDLIRFPIYRELQARYKNLAVRLVNLIQSVKQNN